MQLSREKFEEANAAVQEIIHKTKLIHSEHLSKQTGAEVFLKPENMQHTGSYKIRGDYYKISTLTEEERAKGLITASAGNHAQGVAYAAKQFGAQARIVMPTVTPLIKVNRTKGLGAEVILHGDTYDEAYQHALKLAKDCDYTFVHPFNDLDVATGQGTVAMEILQELPTADYIVVPIGGGGLIAGVAALAKVLNPEITIIGVEPTEAASMKVSLAAEHIVELKAVNTIADGVAVKTVGDVVLPYVKKYVDDIILVDDEELIGAFLDVMENHKMIVENAGLLSVAALRQLQEQSDCKDKKIVCILSGGNMDVITMASIVQHGLIQRDRIFTVSVLLPDKPGELARVARIVSETQGNIIKLDHNQFYSTNRNKAVELKITMEAFGTKHKQDILTSLEDADFKPKLVTPQL
jgi:threonine dehydratase